jgi:hypothetical protein
MAPMLANAITAPERHPTERHLLEGSFPSGNSRTK